MASKVPGSGILVRAAEFALEQDKPIFLDYYAESIDKSCCIGINGSDKYLVKSQNDYTSTIVKAVKCDTCFILITENSIYIVSAEIPVKKITEGK